MDTLLRYLFPVCLILAACSPNLPTPTPIPLSVQFTPAAAPWLAALYDCSGDSAVSAEPRAADFLDPQTADLMIRLGEPETLDSPAYQIGSDTLQVIVNPQNPIHTLDGSQVRDIFDGRTRSWKDIGGPDSPVQVWAFAAPEDIQDGFDRIILNGSLVTSNARLASSPDEMIGAIAGDVHAIGILNARLITSSVSGVYAVAKLPVLALTRPDPPGAIKGILSCLQK